MCLHFLWLLTSSSSLLAQALPTLGSMNSADSMNGKTVGIMNRISDTYIFKHEEKFKENYIQYLYTFHLDPTVFFFLSFYHIYFVTLQWPIYMYFILLMNDLKISYR